MPTATPDSWSAAGLCQRCGLRGVHRDAEVCIRRLRDELGLAQLLLMRKPDEYRRYRRSLSEGRKSNARTRALLDGAAQSAGAGVSGV